MRMLINFYRFLEEHSISGDVVAYNEDYLTLERRDSNAGGVHREIISYCEVMDFQAEFDRPRGGSVIREYIEQCWVG